jgi:hypothetical protein
MGKIIGGIVIVIIVIVGAMYLMNKSSGGSGAPTDQTAVQPVATTSTAQNAAAPTSATANPATGSGTIASLMAMGSVTCTVNVAGTNPSSGTVYVSGGKMRGDFTTTIQGKSMHASMINDGTYMYSWSTMAPEGVKIKVTAGAAASGASAHAGVNPSTNVNYNCSPWTVDAGQFTPPSAISFMVVGGQ